MAILPGSILGIDFGTSNSAASLRTANSAAARLIPLDAQGTTIMPTALFFNTEDRSTHYGRDAMQQYLEGFEGRLMRSLKSLLGSTLLQDKTSVHDGLVSYQDIIAMFMRHIAVQVRGALHGDMPERVVLGRPVHFVDDDPARDQQAEEALGRAAADAGFTNIAFQFEPIAAALDYEQRMAREALVLVVDIGGGTSDFTVVRLGPDRRGAADRSSDVLATTGVHIGGTDFDRRLNLEQVMGHLGFRHIGPRGREVPSRVFFDLSTWHLIQWQYAQKSVREAQQLRSDYADPQRHDRLMTVLNERWGHRLANAVEQAKIGASRSHDTATIALDWLEPALTAEVTPDDLARHLDGALRQVTDCAAACVQAAGLRQQDIGAIYLTGGSSALRPLRHVLAQAFPDVPQVEGDLFGGVASGLAYSRG
ncbi:Hsp70 family protein [Acidovorax sp. Leaf160]|uniref:Hsp70 family protein n=1 Tax=Acidovorax sp. Leaf160 TaxID=1736280 RepID=UPI0006FCE56F|nr:Hsp70 family protein [Acidovorax sp. Leaf160]KQR37901.1 heat-shock protein [Acidovorax sp. Leaf160]